MISSEGRLRLRWVDPADLEQLVDLYRACLPGEGWTAEDFYKFVGNRTGRVNVAKSLVDDKGTVHGSLLYTVTTDEVLIRRINVWPDNRREGLGSFMLNSLVGPRSPVRQAVVAAKVHNKNAVARMFFHSLGFRDAWNGEMDDYVRYEFVRQAALLAGRPSNT